MYRVPLYTFFMGGIFLPPCANFSIISYNQSSQFFFYLLERDREQSEGMAEHYNPLIHPQMSTMAGTGPGPELGVGNSIYVSHMVGGMQLLSHHHWLWGSHWWWVWCQEPELEIGPTLMWNVDILIAKLNASFMTSPSTHEFSNCVLLAVNNLNWLNSNFCNCFYFQNFYGCTCEFLL